MLKIVLYTSVELAITESKATASIPIGKKTLVLEFPPSKMDLFSLRDLASNLDLGKLEMQVAETELRDAPGLTDPPVSEIPNEMKKLSPPGWANAKRVGKLLQRVGLSYTSKQICELANLTPYAWTQVARLVHENPKLFNVYASCNDRAFTRYASTQIRADAASNAAREAWKRDRALSKTPRRKAPAHK